MTEKYYKLSEVAKEFRFTRQTVLHWVKTGKIKAIQIGRAYRVPESEVRRIKEEQ